MQIAPRHIDNAGGIFDFGYGRQVVRLGVMARGEDYVGRRVAVGEGAANGRGRGKGGCDAGDNLERNARGVQSRHLFGGAAEDQRIAGLQADNDGDLPAGVVDHHRVDFVLRDCFVSAALAYINNLSRWRSEIENGLRNEIVVKNDVRGLDKPQSLYSEQIRIARTRSYKVDCAGKLLEMLRRGASA